MGNPILGYQMMLAEFMRLSDISMEVESSIDYSTLSTQDLELCAAKVRDSNPNLACYHAGIAVAHFFSNPDLGCDMMNAGIASIGMMMDFFGIDDEVKTSED